MSNKKNEPKFVEHWQENPDTVARRQLREAAQNNPINMDNYQNIVDYKDRGSVEAIKEGMLNDMVRAGARVGPDTRNNLNLGGINDTRTDKGKKFKVGVE